MPALTIQTDPPLPRPESPLRPPMSPITPPPSTINDDHNPDPSNTTAQPSSSLSSSTTTAATTTAPTLPTATMTTSQARPAASSSSSAQQPDPANPFARTHTYSHSQPPRPSIQQPLPIPISLDTNPDAIALRAALAALQVQKMRATNDIRALSEAKHLALQHPLEFAKDLFAGNVQTRDSFTTTTTAPATGSGPKTSPSSDPSSRPDNTNAENSNVADPRAWQSLPKPQDVVRCPPINWSQYAVVGESLDKLHAEQVAAPTQGTPATLGPGAVYEFRAGKGTQEPYRGVASPYSPMRDRISNTRTRKK